MAGFVAEVGGSDDDVIEGAGVDPVGGGGRWDIGGLVRWGGDAAEGRQVLIDRVDPQTAFVNLHDIHIAVDVDPILLELDPDSDQFVLRIQDTLQGVQQV